MTLGLISLAACAILLIMPSCDDRRRSRTSDPTPVQAASASPSKSPDLLKSGIFDDNPAALKAWLKFIDDGKYRAATGEDFKFSEASKSKLRSMFGDEWYPRINHPAITGNISRRHGFKDLAVMVIDTEKTDPARFSVVIFNVEPDKSELSVHWLFRNRDLSSALLEWHSNWPVVVFYEENGSADPYYINWDDSKKDYFLDKVQVGPDARPGRLREKGEP